MILRLAPHTLELSIRSVSSGHRRLLRRILELADSVSLRDLYGMLVDTGSEVW